MEQILSISSFFISLLALAIAWKEEPNCMPDKPQILNDNLELYFLNTSNQNIYTPRIQISVFSEETEKIIYECGHNLLFNIGGKSTFHDIIPLKKQLYKDFCFKVDVTGKYKILPFLKGSFRQEIWYSVKVTKNPAGGHVFGVHQEETDKILNIIKKKETQNSELKNQCCSFFSCPKQK